MDNLIVACVQQRLRLPQSVDDHRSDLQRFMRAAQNKNARLVIFPELAGMMLALPLLGDFRSTLLKHADRGRRRSASVWQRINGTVADNVASLLRADLRKSAAGLLDVAAPDLWSVYVDVYSSLARTFDMTVVAPSAYLPDPLDGVVRNLAAVFGPDGTLLGTQAKVILHPEDEDLAQAGSGWDVIQTDVGRLGVMIGSDVLFPEVGRLLTYQNAEILIGMGACADVALYHKIRSGMLARMQDNQLFGLVSFMVGPNPLGSRKRDPYVGKSAIFAPQELTPRYSGVLVEMGNQRSEGVLTAEWDFAALRSLWETSDTPLRKQLPDMQVNQLMSSLYARLSNNEHLQLDTDLVENGQTDANVRALDDLPVVASVTSRWPLPSLAIGDDVAADVVDDAWLDEWSPNQEPERAARPNGHGTPPVRFDEETDEMDALPNAPGDDPPRDES